MVRRRDDSPASTGEGTRRTYRPSMDILETPEDLRLVLDVPGVTSDGLEIELDQGTLSITGRVEPRQEGENVRWLLREYGIGDFERSVRIRQEVDPDRISAELKDGVLTVRLPKSERTKPRRVPVQG